MLKKPLIKCNYSDTPFASDRVLKRTMRSSRREFDAEALIRAMVFNRLCDPASKLGSSA